MAELPQAPFTIHEPCHWSFKLTDSGYTSMFNYQTPEDARDALASMKTTGEVIQRHGSPCICIND